ncbi:MAG: hypothetical protein LBH90_08200, partial [Tannerella sp.]|nr:hypothetical protein [Tannerella sp.]
MIILEGNDDNILTISLFDIVSLIPDMENYKWKFIWIEGCSSTLNMLEFEKSINESEDGLLIDSNELLRLSNLFDRLIEVVLIGSENENKLFKYEKDVIAKKECDFFIELIDSSYWEITSSNPDFISKIKSG